MYKDISLLSYSELIDIINQNPSIVGRGASNITKCLQNNNICEFSEKFANVLIDGDENDLLTPDGFDLIRELNTKMLLNHGYSEDELKRGSYGALINSAAGIFLLSTNKSILRCIPANETVDEIITPNILATIASCLIDLNMNTDQQESILYYIRNNITYTKLMSLKDTCSEVSNMILHDIGDTHTDLNINDFVEALVLLKEHLENTDIEASNRIIHDYIAIASKLQHNQNFWNSLYFTFDKLYGLDVQQLVIELERILTGAKEYTNEKYGEVTYIGLRDNILGFLYVLRETYENVPLSLDMHFIQEVIDKIIVPPYCDKIWKGIKTDFEAGTLVLAASDKSKYIRDELGLLHLDSTTVSSQIEMFSRNYNTALESYLKECDSIAMEGRAKSSDKLEDAQTKVYHSYRKYKDNEQKIDSQLTKLVSSMGKLAIGDTRSEIIEGKNYTVLGVLKKMLGTAALFSFGPIKAICALLIRYALKKNITDSERKKIVSELNAEIEIITEKIDDAKGDGNRQAKYNMMRTKTQLVKARDKIKMGLETDRRNLDKAKDVLETSRREN